jgi:hypothetical protein
MAGAIGEIDAADDSRDDSGAQAAIARVYQLPHGFTAEFRAEPEKLEPGAVNVEGIVCEWSPHRPHIRSARARRKFLRSCTAARADFLRDLAQGLGGAILNVDLDEHSQPLEATVFRPQVAQ